MRLTSWWKREIKKAPKKKKQQHEKEWCAFENMSVSDSNEESSNSAQVKKEKLEKLSSDANLNLNVKNNHSSNQLKKTIKDFF